MLRIRLHGRGGQGIKTASQILGTAAHLAGFQAQDFPLYGAERRGAPITAYARVSKNIVLERGAIAQPDILLIGDETLLSDPLASVTEGTESSTLIFINSRHPSPDLKKHYQLESLPVQLDISGLCQKYIQKPMILSTALAAVGVRLMGHIGLHHLLKAIRDELGQERLSADQLANNLKLAEEAFQKVPSFDLEFRKFDDGFSASHLVVLERRPPVDSVPVIFATGNMALRKTGNWRTHRPVIHYEECNGCAICYARCPEGDIRMDANEKPVIDYDHCKGCLICATECPKHAIEIIREVASWN
ncbi:MAG: 2-oxoacid:acceptor oxidoreductase family protein [Nitrospinota bacterium]|nr:2-oxoacid:acceptor oxidoreductase family protein [Nitrospinota bacterium]